MFNMPLVTPDEVIDAVFTYRQRAALLCARRRWEKRWKSYRKRAPRPHWHTTHYELASVVAMIGELQRMSCSVCLKFDTSWRTRLVGSAFWKQQERRSFHVSRQLEPMQGALEHSIYELRHRVDPDTDRVLQELTMPTLLDHQL